MKKILISGGGGNLAKEIVKANKSYNILSLSKSQLNICNKDKLDKIISEIKPDIFIHTAALTRPMVKHIESPDDSIKNNIIGTSNVVLTCIKYNIKLIYISTDYVYPCIEGNYSENSALFPVNEYAWSKLGGECAVKLYKNSLILRMALCQKPFPHPKALVDVKKSYLFMDKAAKVILKLINKKGTINVGGNPLSPYEFIKKSNPNIKKIYLNEIKDVNMGVDASMNIDKLNKILNND
jgi:dTDP-4-dehydrorhamnose reductase